MRYQRLGLLAILQITTLIAVYGQVFKNKDLAITQLNEGLWVVETTDMTTMYIVEGSERAMLIDTGTKCDSLDVIIGKITSKPLDVVITHAHPDHAGNIKFFKEIYLHPADTVLMPKGYDGKVNFLKDGEIFDLGDRKLVVSYLPGHTPGSIALLDYEAGYCFTGDTFGSGLVWLQLRPFSSMQTYINSCEKMLELMGDKIDKVYCGHYPHVKKALDREYIFRMKELAEAINSGNPPDPKPYNIKVPISCENPMISSDGVVSIVYDPEHIIF